MQISRGLSFVVVCALSAFVVGCSSGTQEEGGTGSLSLGLEIGDVTVEEVDWVITGGDMEPMSGTINTSARGSTASIEVFGLPPGDGYTIALSALSTDGEATCNGSAEFGIDAGAATDVMVMLNCKVPSGLGGVRVNGKLNVCAQLSKVIVSPLQTSVGNAIDLFAAGEDVENDEIRFWWMVDGGDVPLEDGAEAQFICTEEGEFEITVTVSDDDWTYCKDSWTVPVTCVGDGGGGDADTFNRIASFLVCSQLDPTCNDDTETASEIVAASEDGNTLVYTDSPLEVVGFVDISAPSAPSGLGLLELPGEPTSVAVAGPYALVGVNTSEDFVNTSGDLLVIDIASRTVVRSLPLGGQPDSVAVSPDKTFAAIAIENERDEDLGDGAPPQLPPGFVVIVDIASGNVDDWTTTDVNLEGIADLYPEDPEPEYVDINENNVAVVTLQENNHIVLIDLTTASVVGDFSAGSVDLDGVDATEDDPAINDKLSILQIETLESVPREPDGVAWISTDLLATADEGDLDGGSRGFTIFNAEGDVVFTSGNANDQMTARVGHYPDSRSENKGNEPENADYGVYGDDAILIVASERSSVLFIYDVADPTAPELTQVLPAGAGPEGILTLSSRNLLIAASEEDSRGDKIRSVLNIYEYGTDDPTYPTISSTNREDGSPIPFAALSGLAADDSQPGRLYSIEDSYYGSNRIFGIDITQTPAALDTEITIRDTNDEFAQTPTDSEGNDDEVFSPDDLAAMINLDDDKSVNIDPEGIDIAFDGGFWVASEGAGTIGDPERPITSLNFIFKTDAQGVIEAVIQLPEALNAGQLRFGFEGIAEYDGKAYVAFQRAWTALGDENPRIGIYDVASETWSFLFYPLDAVESQNGGWVGLSDITSLGDGSFLVVERDNQGGPDAAVKRLYVIDTNGLDDGDTLEKTLVRDLLTSGDLTATNGLVAEKIEGSAVTDTGEVYIVNDNDGVEDNSGEINLINLGDILD